MCRIILCACPGCTHQPPRTYTNPDLWGYGIPVRDLGTHLVLNYACLKQPPLPFPMTKIGIQHGAPPWYPGMESLVCNQAPKFEVGGKSLGIKSSKNGNGDALECKDAKIFFTETLCQIHLAEAHPSAQQAGPSLPHSQPAHSSIPPPSVRPGNIINEYIANSPQAHFLTITTVKMAKRAQLYIQRARNQYNRARGFEDEEEFGADKLPPGRMR